LKCRSPEICILQSEICNPEPVMDLHGAIKLALTKAKAHFDKGENEAAAAAYDNAARLMAMFAEEAVSRDIESGRKAKAVEYRTIAARLRRGESPAPSPVGRSRPSDGPGGRQNEGAGAAAPDGDETEITAAVKRLIQQANVSWADIGGLEETKNEIKYALGLSVARPPEGVAVSGFRNILLYGPPGTGKTLLAAATSNAFRPADLSKDAAAGAGTGGAAGAVFYNVKVSSVMSKYFGESTKIVSELYGQARDTSPAVIFLDEFEALAVNRDADNTGPERRILSTILSELDGLSEKGRRDIYVLTIAATNRPWDMDPAVLSRFEKQIYIPLPDDDARSAMLAIMLDRRGFKVRGPREALVGLTKGLSGREIERLCKEVAGRMITDLNAELPRLVDQGMEAVRNYQVKVRPLEVSEFEAARRAIVPVTGPAESARYEKWRQGLQR
jgi:SpoVK/Ycf46/Vps4 family AAA+-type ATPase